MDRPMTRARCGSSSRIRRIKRAARRQGKALVTLAVACAVSVASLTPRTSQAQELNQDKPQAAPAPALPKRAAGLSRATSRATPVSFTRLAALRPGSAPSSTCRRVRLSSPDAQDAGAVLVHNAERLVGCPYRFGGASRSEGFDCSGLVWYVHHVMHMPIPRRAEEQGLYAAQVSEAELKPGDLLFFHFAEGDPRASHLDFAPAYINHVAIYIGGGRFIHAPKTGRQVQYGRLEDFRPYFLKAGRYWSGSTATMVARG